ncbi:MAG: hypothetical protein FJ404_15540 [Verrucomicrobia bacterium]|nr:hypothetical protein [Verrucomicrobiota bacterium]
MPSPFRSSLRAFSVLVLFGMLDLTGLAAAAETRFAERNDSIAEKVQWLEAARARGDYRQARALAESIRHTLEFEEQEHGRLPDPLSGASLFIETQRLPVDWREWIRGWRYAKLLRSEEREGLSRNAEPVEWILGFPADSLGSPAREIRVVRLDGARPGEVRSQVSEVRRRGGEWQARVTILADAEARERGEWMVLFGNPDAELPGYDSDLKVTGEGVGLDIENEFFKASLSRQMGQLERLAYKREHGLELFAGGDGHGEPPGIDWAHDYVTAGDFQKMRITNWPECPDYSVVRGPLSVVVRRWGFPASPLHPVFTPSRVHIEVEYRFYAGTPWFMKLGSMEVVRDLTVGYLRDDEWVFSGMSFNETLWMGRDGKLHVGEVPAPQAEDLWGVGFFNRTTKDAFIGLFLDHEATGTPRLPHSGSPTLHYRWHGQLWSRAFFHQTTLKAGAKIRQRNAYLTLPFDERNGAPEVESLRKRLLSPLTWTAPSNLDFRFGKAPVGRLARPGEAGDAPISKSALWKALEACRDVQLYSALPSVVELGLVRDIRVRGETVRVLMTLPHRGRPRAGFFSTGSGGNDAPIRDVLLKVPGVKHVVVDTTWDPPWSSNELTPAGRSKLGLESNDALRR